MLLNGINAICMRYLVYAMQLDKFYQTFLNFIDNLICLQDC